MWEKNRRSFVFRFSSTRTFKKNTNLIGQQFFLIFPTLHLTDSCSYFQMMLKESLSNTSITVSRAKWKLKNNNVLFDFLPNHYLPMTQTTQLSRRPFTVSTRRRKGELLASQWFCKQLTIQLTTFGYKNLATQETNFSTKVLNFTIYLFLL